MRSFRSSLSTGVLSSPSALVTTPSVPPPLPPIVQVGAPVLRARAEDVPPEAIGSPELQRLVRSMIDVMRDAPGVGLAAPQIGEGVRLFVVEDRPEYMAKMVPAELERRGRVPVPLRVFFNPVLRLVGDRTATFIEGCLSVSGFAAQVERSLDVELEGLDENGVLQTWSVSGWPARILQHEFDHLEGTLYIDRMQTRTFAKVE